MMPPYPPSSGQSGDLSSLLAGASGISGAKLIQRLPVDVYAEFEPQRLTLGYVQQMTEGLLVDVGHLSQNRVRLHVDGKTVALGELVIVGDRFGVLITAIPEPGNGHDPQTQGQFPDEMRSLGGMAGAVTPPTTPAPPMMPVQAQPVASSPITPSPTPRTPQAPPSEAALMAEVDRLIQGDLG